MPFTKFTNLDFDQIKTSIKDYLRANSNFTDFDFEGSNFSVLIDTLAYNTYITAFNSNMIVNESFLDSATIRENVVSLARNIGYVPKSRSAARAEISFSVSVSQNLNNLPISLEPGILCVGDANETSFVFSIPERITAIVKNGVAVFGTTEKPIVIYQGSYLSKRFVVDSSLDQRFILDNPFIDTSTIAVFVRGASESGGLGSRYIKVDNILNINKFSDIFLLQEVQDEKYELLFGDGIFGKKLENNSIVNVSYIVTDGRDGNGASLFSFSGVITDSAGNRVVPTDFIDVSTVSPAKNGGDIEPLSSIKYFAPRLYSSQYRAVTSRDYEAIIQQIYPNTESVSVVGGEELDPPQFGKVVISIKPRNGNYISDFERENILLNLKQYSVSGINQEIIDLKVLYVEIDSSIYYDTSKVDNSDQLKSLIIDSLQKYSESPEINKFGGRFKYSKILQLIDNVDTNTITSNITKVKIRRNLKALINQFSQYELCFGNRFHINVEGKNIKSSGFYIEGYTNPVYFTDIPNKDSNGNLDGSGKGFISIVQKQADGNYQIIGKSGGTVDYNKGEINIFGVVITSTVKPNNVIEVQANPESNDVVGLKDLYVEFDLSNSKINMVKDVISSGEDISGVTFVRDYYVSSYSNGVLERQ